MAEYVTPLLQWLNANPQWAGFVTFFISAAESVAIIGTIVPGSITMTAIGALAGAGIIPLWETLFWATFGAVVGDGISYWIGHYFKNGIRRMWPFSTNPGVLEKGEVFVHKYGVMSVFIGRFVGPVRALVPVVAGMLGMKPLQFTISNIASAIGWAPAYMLPGILLGAASRELPPDIAMHVIMVLLLMTLFVVLCIWVLFKILQLISNRTEQMLNKMWKALKRSRYFHIATVILKHHDPKQHHGQLTLSFYFLLNTLMLLGLLFYVKAVGATNIFVNDALFHLFRGVRSASLDSLMIDITLLGQKQVILPIIATLFCWFLYTKRPRVAFHTLALGILAAGSVFVIKHLIKSPRPWGIFNSPETFSMPSGHTTLATTIYIGIAFMLVTTMRPKYRKLVYTPAVLIAFTVGFSRLYLGAHWFTDVLAAWLLSAALLILIIMSFHRKHEKHINQIGTTAVCLLTLCISYGLYHHLNFTQLKVNYTRLEWPTSAITIKEWWQKDGLIPAFRVSLFGFPSQRINVQWAGKIDDIRETLLKHGWETPPARDFVSTLHRISDIQSGEYLPLVSPQYLDNTPSLIMVKRVNGQKKLLALRLWESSRVIKESGAPLWVGTMAIVPRSYSWLFRKQQYDVGTDAAFIFKGNSDQWQWKMLKVSAPVSSKRTAEQEMLLIAEKNPAINRK